MKKVLILTFVFIGVLSYGQRSNIIGMIESGDSVAIGMHEVRIALINTAPVGGTILRDGLELRRIFVDDHIDSLLNNGDCNLIEATIRPSGRKIGINPRFIQKIYADAAGTVIQTRQPSLTYEVSETVTVMTMRAKDCIDPMPGAGVFNWVLSGDSGPLIDINIAGEQLDLRGQGPFLSAVLSGNTATINFDDNQLGDSLIQNFSLVTVNNFNDSVSNLVYNIMVDSISVYFDTASSEVYNIMIENLTSYGDTLITYFTNNSTFNTLINNIFNDSITFLGDSLVINFYGDSLFQDLIEQTFVTNIGFYGDTLINYYTNNATFNTLISNIFYDSITVYGDSLVINYYGDSLFQDLIEQTFVNNINFYGDTLISVFDTSLLFQNLFYQTFLDTFTAIQDTLFAGMDGDSTNEIQTLSNWALATGTATKTLSLNGGNIKIQEGTDISLSTIGDTILRITYTGTAGTNSNLAIADLVQDTTVRMHDFSNGNQDWNNMQKWNIDVDSFILNSDSAYYVLETLPPMNDNNTKLLSINQTTGKIEIVNRDSIDGMIDKSIPRDDISADGSHTQNYLGFSQTWLNLDTLHIQADTFEFFSPDQAYRLNTNPPADTLNNVFLFRDTITGLLESATLDVAGNILIQNVFNSDTTFNSLVIDIFIDSTTTIANNITNFYAGDSLFQNVVINIIGDTIQAPGITIYGDCVADTLVLNGDTSIVVNCDTASDNQNLYVFESGLYQVPDTNLVRLGRKPLLENTVINGDSSYYLWVQDADFITGGHGRTWINSRLGFAVKDRNNGVPIADGPGPEVPTFNINFLGGVLEHVIETTRFLRIETQDGLRLRTPNVLDSTAQTGYVLTYDVGNGFAEFLSLPLRFNQAENGLHTHDDTIVHLGGTLIHNTEIFADTNNFAISDQGFSFQNFHGVSDWIFLGQFTGNKFMGLRSDTNNILSYNGLVYNDRFFPNSAAPFMMTHDTSENGYETGVIMWPQLVTIYSDDTSGFREEVLVGGSEYVRIQTDDGLELRTPNVLDNSASVNYVLTLNSMAAATKGRSDFVDVNTLLSGWTKGSAVAEQVTVWASTDSLYGDANFTWDGDTLRYGGDAVINYVGAGNEWIAHSSGGNYLFDFETSNGVFSFRDIMDTMQFVFDLGTNQFKVYNISEVATTIISGTGDSYFNGGDVGFGLADPDKPIEAKAPGINNTAIAVQRSGGTQEVVTLGTSSDAGLIQINNSGGSPVIQLNGSGFSYFNAGNVGIADATPDYSLDVNGTFGVAADVTFEAFTGSKTGVPNRLLAVEIDGDVHEVKLGANLSFSSDTLNASGSGVTALNGLTESGTDTIIWGGALTQNTTIDGTSNLYTVTYDSLGGIWFNLDGASGSGSPFRVDAMNNSFIIMNAVDGNIELQNSGSGDMYLGGSTGEVYVGNFGQPLTRIESDRINLRGTEQVDLQNTSIKTTLVPGTHSVVFHNATAGTDSIILPASPQVGDIYTIVNVDYADSWILSGNGNNIDGVGSLTMDDSLRSVVVAYGGATPGWRITADKNLRGSAGGGGGSDADSLTAFSITSADSVWTLTLQSGQTYRDTFFNFGERVQDSIGTILTDSPSIDFTYTDNPASITAAVLPAGVNAQNLDWSAAGADHEIYFNDNGSLSHGPNLKWNNDIDELEITNGAISLKGDDNFVAPIGEAIIYRDSVLGLVQSGIGNTYDYVLSNKTGQQVIRIQTGTQIVTLPGHVSYELTGTDANGTLQEVLKSSINISELNDDLGIITGTAAADQISYYTGANTMTGNANLLYSSNDIQLDSGRVIITGDANFTAASGNAYMYRDVALGLVQYGIGTTNDYTLANKTGQQVMLNPTGTQYAYFPGSVGIGVSSPGYPLDVGGAGNKAIRINGTSSSFIVMSSGSVAVRSDGSGSEIRFGQAATSSAAPRMNATASTIAIHDPQATPGNIATFTETSRVVRFDHYTTGTHTGVPEAITAFEADGDIVRATNSEVADLIDQDINIANLNNFSLTNPHVGYYNGTALVDSDLEQGATGNMTMQGGTSDQILTLVGGTGDARLTLDGSAGVGARLHMLSSTITWQNFLSGTSWFLEPVGADGLYIIRNDASQTSFAHNTSSGITGVYSGGVENIRLRPSGDSYFIGGDVGFGTLTNPTQSIHTNENAIIEGWVRLDSTLYDGNNEVGTSGQVLSSTGTGVDWVDAGGGVGGSGTTGFLPYFSASTTLADSPIQRISAGKVQIDVASGDAFFSTETDAANREWNFGSESSQSFVLQDNGGINVLTVENAVAAGMEDFIYVGNAGTFNIGGATETYRFGFQSDGIGSTFTDAEIAALFNTTDAAAGLQQFSPALLFKGEGWKTNATAASQETDIRMYVEPVQGAANPDLKFHIQSQVNGGGWDTGITYYWDENNGGLPNLGIGTASPDSRIHVNAGLFAAKLHLETTGENSSSLIDLNNSHANNVTWRINNNSVTDDVEITDVDNSKTVIRLRDNGQADGIIIDTSWVQLGGAHVANGSSINRTNDLAANQTAWEPSDTSGTGAEFWSSRIIYVEPVVNNVEIQGIESDNIPDYFFVTICNESASNAFIFKNAHTSAQVADRFDIGSDITITAKRCRRIHYDASRWRVGGG